MVSASFPSGLSKHFQWFKTYFPDTMSMDACIFVNHVIKIRSAEDVHKYLSWHPDDWKKALGPHRYLQYLPIILNLIII